MTHRLVPPGGAPLSSATLEPQQPGATPLSSARLGPAHAPTVSLTAPAAGDTLWAGETTTWTASASVPEGSVTECNFEIGSAPVLVGSGALVGGVWTASLAHPVIAAGTHNARARALSSAGLYGYSADVSVTVYNVSALTRLTQLCPGLCLWVGDGSGTYVRIDAGNTRAGDQIDRWWDQSPGGKHAVEDTDSHQPNLTAYGSLPELRSEAVGQYMHTPFVLSNLSALTVYSIARVNTAGGRTQFPVCRSPTAFAYELKINTTTTIHTQIGYYPGITRYATGTATVTLGSAYHCVTSIYDGTAGPYPDTDTRNNPYRLQMELDTSPVTLAFTGYWIPSAIWNGCGDLDVCGGASMQLLAMAAAAHTPSERAEVYAALRTLCPDWTA